MNAVTHYVAQMQNNNKIEPERNTYMKHSPHSMKLIEAARNIYTQLSVHSMNALTDVIAITGGCMPECMESCLYQSVIVDGNTLTIYNGKEQKVESFQLI